MSSGHFPSPRLAQSAALGTAPAECRAQPRVLNYELGRTVSAGDGLYHHPPSPTKPAASALPLNASPAKAIPCVNRSRSSGLSRAAVPTPPTPKTTNWAALLGAPGTWTFPSSVNEDTAAYFQGLCWMLLLLSERALRDPAVPAVLGRLETLLAVVTVELRPEEPRLSRPGEKTHPKIRNCVCRAQACADQPLPLAGSPHNPMDNLGWGSGRSS